jgi:hypothetical protein
MILKDVSRFVTVEYETTINSEFTPYVRSIAPVVEFNGYTEQSRTNHER